MKNGKAFGIVGIVVGVVGFITAAYMTVKYFCEKLNNELKFDDLCADDDFCSDYDEPER